MVNWSDYKPKNSCNISDWNIFKNQSLTDEKLDSDLSFRNRPTDSTLPHSQQSFYSQKEQSCLVSPSFQKQNTLWVNRSSTKEPPSCEGISCLTSNIVIPGDIPISSLFGYASAIGPVLFYSERVRSYLRPTRTGSEQRHVFRIHGKFPNQSEFSAEVDTDDTGKKMEVVPKKDQVEEPFYYDAGQGKKFKQGNNYLLRRTEGATEFHWEFGNPKFFLEFSLKLNASKTDLLLSSSSLTLDARGSSDGIKHFAGTSSFKAPLSIIHTRTVTAQDPSRGEVRVDLHILSDGSVARVYSAQSPRSPEDLRSEFWKPRAGKVADPEEAFEKRELFPQRDPHFGTVYRSASSPYAFSYSGGKVDLIPASVNAKVGDSTYVSLNRLGAVKPSQMVLVPTAQQLARFMLNPPPEGNVIQVDLQGEIQNGSNGFIISSHAPLKVQGRFEGSGKERKFVPDSGQRLVVLVYDANSHRPLPGLLEMEVTVDRQGGSFLGFDYSSRPTDPTVSFKAPFTNAEIGSVGVGSLERVNPRVAEIWERLGESREGELIPSLSGVSENEGRVTFNVGRRLLSLYLRYSPQPKTYSDPDSWLQDWRYHLASPLELYRAGLDVLSGEILDPETGVVKRVQMIPTEASWFLRVEGEGIVYRVEADIVSNDLSSIQLYDTSPDLAGRMAGKFPEFPSLPPPSKPGAEASAAEKKGEASPSSVIPDLKVTDIQLASPEEDPRSTDVALRVSLSDDSWVELHILRKSSESRAVSPRISGLNGFSHSSSGRAEISVELIPASRDQREAILVHPQAGVDVLIPRPLTTKILSGKVLTAEDLRSIQIRGTASPEVSASMEAAGSPAEDLVCEVPSLPPPTLDLSPLSVPVLPSPLDDSPRVPTREEEDQAIAEFGEDILRALNQGGVPVEITARVGRDLERRAGEPLWNWQVRVHKALVDFAREESGRYNDVYNRFVTRVRRHWEFAGEPKRGSRMYIPAVDDLGTPQGRVLVLSDEEPGTASVEAGVGADSRVCEPADANDSAAPAALEVPTAVTPTGAAQEVGALNEESPSALVCLPEERPRASGAIDLRVTDLVYASDLTFPADQKNPQAKDFPYKALLSDGSWIELHISRNSSEKRAVSPRISGLKAFLNSSEGRVEVTVELVPGNRDQKEAILVHPQAGVDVLIPRPLTTKTLSGKTITEEDLQSIQVRGVVADVSPSASAQNNPEPLALVAAAGEVIPAQFVLPVAQQIKAKGVKIKEVSKKEGEYTDYKITLYLSDEARLETWKLIVRVFEGNEKKIEVLDSYYKEVGDRQILMREERQEGEEKRVVLTQQRSGLSVELNPAQFVQRFVENGGEISPDFVEMVQVRGQEAYARSHTLTIPTFIEGEDYGESFIEVEFRMIEAKKIEGRGIQRTFEATFPNGRRIVMSGFMQNEGGKDYFDLRHCYSVPLADSDLPPQNLTDLARLDSLFPFNPSSRTFATVVPLGNGNSLRVHPHAFALAMRKDSNQEDVVQARGELLLLKQEGPVSSAEGIASQSGVAVDVLSSSNESDSFADKVEDVQVKFLKEGNLGVNGIPYIDYEIAISLRKGERRKAWRLKVRALNGEQQKETRVLEAYVARLEGGTKLHQKGSGTDLSLMHPFSGLTLELYPAQLIRRFEKGDRVQNSDFVRAVRIRRQGDLAGPLFNLKTTLISGVDERRSGRRTLDVKFQRTGKESYMVTFPEGDRLEFEGTVRRGEPRSFNVTACRYFPKGSLSPIDLKNRIRIEQSKLKGHLIVIVPLERGDFRIHPDAFHLVSQYAMSQEEMDRKSDLLVIQEILFTPSEPPPISSEVETGAPEESLSSQSREAEISSAAPETEVSEPSSDNVCQEEAAAPIVPRRTRGGVDQGFLITGGRGPLPASFILSPRLAAEVNPAEDPMMLAGSVSPRPSLPVGNEEEISQELRIFAREIGQTDFSSARIGWRIYLTLNEQIGAGYRQFIPLRDYLNIVIRATDNEELRLYRNDLLLHATNQWVQLFNTPDQREIVLGGAADRAGHFMTLYQTRRAVREEVREELAKLVGSIYDHLEKAKEEELRRRKDAEDKK